MNTKESIIKAYDMAADDYAAIWWNEFENKHFDQIILKWFSSQIPKYETVLEIGSGPGEVSGFLSNLGVKCIGSDISTKMIESAGKYFPGIPFEVQDFFDLTYADKSFSGVIAYYAIVNLTIDQIKLTFQEVKRVLKDHGLFLFTFHVFENEKQKDIHDFFGKKDNNLTFYFFKVEDMKGIVEKLGFEIVDILLRYPYKDIDYPSKKAYFILRKK